MNIEDPDRAIARLFEQQHRADASAAPDVGDLLARPRTRRAPWKLAIARIAVAAVAIAAVLLLWPARHPTGGPDTALPPAASQLANWKSPTDSLLRTPGSDLWTRVPILVSPVSSIEPAHPLSTTKGVGE